MSVAVLSTFHVHPTEDLLEEYIFGRLQEPALSELEDHLFTCCSCQATLAELDDYVRAAKIALAEFQHARLAPVAAPPAWARLPVNTTAIWALGLVLVLSGSAMIWRRMQTPSETVTATLTAFRGGNAAALTHAPAGKPLDLIIDTTSLPPARAYRLQIVNASGNNAWSGALMASGEKLSAHLPKGLGPGVYWVRLYEPQIPGEAGLLREFGLRLE
jgi:anti-sigma factor RsiW